MHPNTKFAASPIVSYKAGLVVIGLIISLLLAACGSDVQATPTTQVNTPPTANLNVDSGNNAVPTANLNAGTATTTSVAGQAAANGTITIRISYPGDEKTGNGALAANFAKLASQKTNGKVQVQFYPNSSIAGGDQLTAVNMVEAGKVEAVVSQASFFTTIDPIMELLGYPFLFANRQNAMKFVQSDGGKNLLGSLEQYNFKMVAYGDQGFRQVSNSKHSVATPSDLSGLKIRIPQSNLYTKVFKALGAEPVTMNFSPDLYKALQNKTLDGQDAPLGFTYSNNYQQVQPYYTVLNWSWDPLLLVFNKNFWQSLPADVQQALTSAGNEATTDFNNSVDSNEKTIMDKFQQAGVQVTVLNGSQLQPFVDATKSLYTEAETKFGKDVVDPIVKAAQGS